MDKYSEIKRKIRAIATGSAPISGDATVFLAEVKSVAGAKCSVQLDELVLTDVRLTSVIGDDKKQIVIAPKVGSVVLVACLSSSLNNLVVIQYSEVDNIIINGGANGGLTNTPELKKQLDKLTARVDGIIDAIKNAVPTPYDGGTNLQTTMKALLATIVDKEDFSAIEDTTIKH